MWKFFKLTRNSNVNIPHFTSTEPKAGIFSKFLIRKTTTIRNNIISDSIDNTAISPWMQLFNCELDPLPTLRFRKCADQLLPPLKAVTNVSIVSVMTLRLKRSFITVLVKRSGLNKKDMQNYCHISNLHFIFKPEIDQFKCLRACACVPSHCYKMSYNL